MVRGIDYNEGGEPDLGYAGVDMSWTEDGERKFKVFNTGDFVKDWMHALKWFIEGDFGDHLCNSSSVDHFIMDGGSELYDSAYIGFDENKNAYLYYEWDDRGLEVFVPKGMKPTWEEFKEIYK
jgi:hypothetical protein